MALLSHLEFGSYLAYAPRSDSDMALRSRGIRDALKHEQAIGDPPRFFSQYISQSIASSIRDLPFSDFFGPGVYLVPVPKSSLMQQEELWVPALIARGLQEQGYGSCSSAPVRSRRPHSPHLRIAQER